MFLSSQKRLHRPKTCQAKVFGSLEYFRHVLGFAVHNTETGYSELFSTLKISGNKAHCNQFQCYVQPNPVHV